MNTRPTTDRVKENVFNLIQDHVRGAEVLEPVQFERRRAAHCDFVEHNKAAYGIVSKNVESARVKDKAALHRTEAAEFVFVRRDLSGSSVRRRDLRKCAETDRRLFSRII